MGTLVKSLLGHYLALLAETAFIMVTLFILSTFLVATLGLNPCPGDTRGDRRCNHDSTHRVCAKIGIEGTSFWEFTGQSSWCGTIGSYGGPYGSLPRCPPAKPSWCICKWATARWIAGEGCGEAVQFDCEATDVRDLRSSYLDFNVDLKPAHDCLEQKCKKQWDECPASRATSGV